jgi:hypothetical protein
LLIEEANDTETLRTYSYNYLDRLASFDDGSVLVNYTYRPDDIRTRATVNGSDIDYLIDPFNHTGYAQVLRADIAGDANTVYFYGHDAIAQAEGAADPNYFLCDGHGTTFYRRRGAGFAR